MGVEANAVEGYEEGRIIIAESERRSERRLKYQSMSGALSPRTKGNESAMTTMESMEHIRNGSLL